MSVWTYQKQAELPYFSVAWYDGSGDLINFNDYTFEVKLISKKTNTVALTKTNFIVGSNLKPNITVVWRPGELDLTEGLYILRLKATNPDGDRLFSPDNEPVIRIIS
jgi:hypothetical protein